jgi:hypothetical protein
MNILWYQLHIYLREIVYGSRRELSPAVLVDYFGQPGRNLEEANMMIIMGVYEGLIKYKGVWVNLLKECYMANRLDELIHKKYWEFVILFFWLFGWE